MSDRPYIVGIAGPSCSGKTSLARALAGGLPGETLVFELDWYYLDQGGRTIDEINVDVPWALDDALIVDQLERLAGGHPIVRPVYDYATHARTGRGVRVSPADAIVVEGLFALYWERLRRLFDLSVFLLADHKTCLARRIDRDTRERGRTADEVVRQYRRQVGPMYDRFVRPTRHRADVLLGGDGSIAAFAARVARLTGRKSLQPRRARRDR